MLMRLTVRTCGKLGRGKPSTLTLATHTDKPNIPANSNFAEIWTAFPVLVGVTLVNLSIARPTDKT